MIYTDCSCQLIKINILVVFIVELNSTIVKSDDIHTKANKHKINRDDIETLHKCNECGKNNKLYWSEQKRPNLIFSKKRVLLFMILSS